MWTQKEITRTLLLSYPIFGLSFKGKHVRWLSSRHLVNLKPVDCGLQTIHKNTRSPSQVHQPINNFFQILKSQKLVNRKVVCRILSSYTKIKKTNYSLVHMNVCGNSHQPWKHKTVNFFKTKINVFRANISNLQ